MKAFLWFLCLLPLVYLIYRLGFGIEGLASFSQFFFNISKGLLGEFPDDPVKYISDITGITALQFLILTLSITPLRRIFKINILKYRRFFGLFTFFYAFLHMLLYLILDHEMNLLLLWHEALQKKFIFFGMASFLILSFLALTSTKKLFARFFIWHRLVYLVAIFTAFHYYLSQKIITLIPVVYITIVFALLVVRFFYKPARTLLEKFNSLFIGKTR